MKARIAALWRYPVKSCAGESVQHLQLDDQGWPLGDRGWAIADAASELTWMGAHARLALVQASLSASGLGLRLRGQSEAVLAEDGPAITVRAWNAERADFDILSAHDAGDAAASLLQAATGAPLRLVRLATDAQRRPGTNALHIVGDGSLAAWAADCHRPPQGMDRRVRANIVLTGEDGAELPPFLEDLATELRIGGLRLQRTQPCVRCVVPGMDPSTGTSQAEVLDALNRLSLNRLPNAPVQFGTYARGLGAGRLQVGDEVELELEFG